MADPPQYIAEIILALNVDSRENASFVGFGYELLIQYMEIKIIPLLQEKKITVACVELTTCGLLSELFTCVPGSSSFFKTGIFPYSTEMKLKFGVPSIFLDHDGPGTVSIETAEFLAKKIALDANASLGIAETGMLPSDFSSKRTVKRAGEVYLAIYSDNNSLSVKLDLQKNLSRLLMRQAIAWEILKVLQKYLTS